MTTIVQITDPHLLATPGEHLMGLDVWARFHAALAQARQLEPDAYFFTGDFCAQEPDAEVYARLRPLLDALEKPYYLAAGNHDNRAMMRRHFELPGTGDDAVYYRATVGNRRFLFIDTQTASIDEAQLAWLAAELRAHPAADIVMHHPPFPLGIQFMDEKYPLKNPEALAEVLAAAPGRRRVFCGHYHNSRVVEGDRCTAYLCPPTSFYINGRAERFARVERPAGYQEIFYANTVGVVPRYVVE